MNWGDWIQGLCYGLGIGSLVITVMTTRVINIQKKTIASQRSTIESLIKTTTLQQVTLAGWERKFGGTSQAGPEARTVRPDQPV